MNLSESTISTVSSSSAAAEVYNMQVFVTESSVASAIHSDAFLRASAIIFEESSCASDKRFSAACSAFLMLLRTSAIPIAITGSLGEMKGVYESSGA